MQRIRTPEIMDDPSLDERLHREALYGLMRINSLSDSYQVLWKRILACAEKYPGKKLRMLDVATGIGDHPIRIARLAEKAGLNIEVSGCDISERSIEFASEYAKRSNADVEFFKLDVINDNLPEGYDIVTSSLFFHHLDESEIVLLLKKMSFAAGKLVLINDITRSRVNLFLVWLATRLLTNSPVVRFDGPVSVKAAFTIPEMKAIAEKAGLAHFNISKQKPCRFLLEWNKAD